MTLSGPCLDDLTDSIPSCVDCTLVDAGAESSLLDDLLVRALAVEVCLKYVAVLVRRILALFKLELALDSLDFVNERLNTPYVVSFLC